MNKIKVFTTGALSLALVLFGATKAQAATVLVSNEAELQAADNPGDTVVLTADISLGERVEFYSSDIIIDGDGHTISPTFTKTDNSNNSALVVFGDNVVVQDLTIDGSAGTDLHGINMYVAQNVLLDNVTVMNNDRTGVGINGSAVTVNNITTSGNGWHGINVDQGGGVTTPAVLTVNGVSTQTDVYHIYVDHYDEIERFVIDTMSQYSFEDGVNNVDDRLYTLSDITSNKSTVLSDSGVMGKGIQNAPGLQKEFNPKSQAASHAGKKK